MNDVKIGKVIHYYGNIKVAVIALTENLNIGDKVKFRHGDIEFEQSVDSMELDHKKVDSAKAGESIAIKTAEIVHQNAAVYKIG